MRYVPVTPARHDRGCRRGQDPTSDHYGVDQENCERCRNLIRRLDEVRDRRVVNRGMQVADAIEAGRLKR